MEKGADALTKSLRQPHAANRYKRTPPRGGKEAALEMARNTTENYQEEQSDPAQRKPEDSDPITRF